MGQLMKVVVSRDKETGVSTEHFQKSFSEIMVDLSGKDVDLYLTKYEEGVVGWEFKAEAFIGNCQNNLTQHDYYDAYSRII